MLNRAGKLSNRGEIVMHREQFVGDRPGFRKLASQQISLEQVAQPLRIGIDVRNLMQGGNRSGAVSGLEQVLPLHQQGVRISGIERQHALQDFLSAAQRSLRAHTLSGSGKNLPGIGLLAETDRSEEHTSEL